MRIGCVIQGDIRRGTPYVIDELSKKFDFTVLSTWANEDSYIPAGNYSVIRNEKPPNGGISNRNFQRLSSAKGVQEAKAFGCDYILKWRTDMLPSFLDLNILLEWAQYKVPDGVESRIVMPAFRNLSVDPDWFSSIPDLFAFGHTQEMEMLWGDIGFDYALSMNMPKQMSMELMKIFPSTSDLSELYCSESELYAIYKSRLQSKLGRSLDHREIAVNYFRLFDYRRLGIFWFGKSSGFRSVGQAWEHPWWSEADWKSGKVSAVAPGYIVAGRFAFIFKLFSAITVLLERSSQTIKWWVRK
ncbi:hypothetical protein [Polynucleobacter necessarius]|uniref:hypothetical protein n=1 Tax=Polynucleobacter necessarius TaxID=576610 RepID=UPI000E09DC39|nr:hypothetical protein [Polynucleobacter necessarius]